MNPPGISIIIPAKNNEDTILFTLKSIINQTYSGKIEVIIVIDGGSKDETYNIVRKFSKSNRIPMKIIKLRYNVTPAKARNIGICISSYDLILFLDADCMLLNNWIEIAVKDLTNNYHKNVVGVGGALKYIFKSQELNRVLAKILNRSLIFSGGSVQFFISSSKSKFVKALSTSNSLFYKESIIKIGKFNEDLRYCEDSDLSQRLRKQGYKLLYDNKLVCLHCMYRIKELKDFISYIYNYGKGRGTAFVKNFRLLTNSIIFAFIYLIILITFSLISIFSSLFIYYLGLLILAYITAILIDLIINVKLNIRWPYLINGILIIIMSHVSYLAGFLMGLFKEKFKRK